MLVSARSTCSLTSSKIAIAEQRLSREDDADTLVKDEPKADPSTRDSEVAPDYLMFMEADTFGDFQRLAIFAAPASFRR